MSGRLATDASTNRAESEGLDDEIADDTPECDREEPGETKQSQPLGAMLDRDQICTVGEHGSGGRSAAALRKEEHPEIRASNGGGRRASTTVALSKPATRSTVRRFVRSGILPKAGRATRRALLSARRASRSGLGYPEGFEISGEMDQEEERHLCSRAAAKTLPKLGPKRADTADARLQVRSGAIFVIVRAGRLPL